MAFGGTVKLTGESEYRKALASITGELKVLNSEMKVVTSAYDSNNATAEDLKSTNQALNKKLEEQKEKVNVLKKALEDSEKETGENSETTKKWQVELNKAQAEVNETTKKIDKNTDTLEKMEKANVSNTKELAEFEKQASKAGDSSLKLGDIIKANLISEGIIAGIKGLATAVKGVGSAFVDLGKQAIASYGEYEQLVGGVETLFGTRGAKTVEEYAKLVGKSVDEVGTEFDSLMTAQNKVIENANNAFASSGLSANEYMETVTDFSASLISSLGGDTLKASEYANMAVTDMSDNANRMGSDMESIQNAYKGFAKGQFNMLDNLKLGYGGTQKEMYRLLQDAKAIDKDFDAVFSIDNKGHLEAEYADIVEAIHIVQQNMGITGATAEEASETMQGSAKAMQGAWKNLITGIADDNADFETLVNNLVVSIVGEEGEGGVLNNFLPRIETALDGIVQMVVSLTESLLPQIATIAIDLINTLATGISDNLPALLESASIILNTLINGIVTVLPTLIPVAMQMIMTLITAVLQNLPLILDTGIKMLVSLVEGIADSLPEIIPVMVESVMLMVETLIDNIDLIIDAGIDLLIALADGLIIALPDLVDKIPILIDKLLDAILENFPLILDAGIQIIVQLATGLIEAIPQLVAKLPTIIAKMVKGFNDMRWQIIGAGKDLLYGLFEGLLNPTIIWNNLVALYDGIIGGIKEFFGIHSPSTKFRDEIGTNLALGLGEGFSDTMSDVSADMQRAIPTEFDADIYTNVNAGSGYSGSSTYDMMVTAFKQALTDVKVVMNNREMGAFVTDTVERVVYS